MYVTQLHIYKGNFNGAKYLNKKLVSTISPRLTNEIDFNAQELKNSSSICFKGSELLGDFYLNEAEAHDYLAQDEKYSDVIRKFLGGKNLTSSVNIEPDRWVIFFKDWNLEDCRKLFPDLITKLEERFFSDGPTAPSRKKWWQFHRHRSVMYDGMSKLDRILIRPYTSNMCWFEFGN